MPHSFVLASPAAQDTLIDALDADNAEEQFLYMTALGVADVFNRIVDEKLVPGETSLAHIVVRRRSMPADLVVITEADWTEDRVDYFDELQEGLHDELRDTFAIWDESPLKLESHLVIVGMPPQAGPHGVLPRLPDKDSTLTVPETARLEHWRGLSGP